MTDLTKRIRVRMKSKGISISELSRRTDIPQSAMHRYLTGETSSVPSHRLTIIASALNVTPNYLLGWDEKNTTAANSDVISSLEKSCVQVVEWLFKYGNPHQSIVINQSSIRLVSDDIGIPIDENTTL